jgi:hypothetical protein
MGLSDVYAIAVNAGFKSRITAAVTKAAYDITNESPDTTNHSLRLAWAKSTMKDPLSVTEQMVWTVVQDSGIQSAGISVADSTVQNVVNGNINNFAL